MEFFDWMGIPSFFIEYYLDTTGPITEIVAALIRAQIITLCVAAGLYVIGVVFCGLGLITLAKNAGIKHRWMGFLPFLNTYYIGKVAGEVMFFGKKTNRLGLFAMIAEILYVGLNIFSLVLSFALTNANFYEPFTNAESGITTWRFDTALMPSEMRWMATASTVVDIVNYVYFVVVLLIMWMLYLGFFRKYYARSPFLMSFLCTILPFRGFVIFAVRNNAPVDYNEYMRRRMEAVAAQQRQYGYGPYDPYGPTTPPQQPGGQGSAGQSPFSDFGEEPSSDGASTPSGNSDDDPFSDF